MIVVNDILSAVQRVTGVSSQPVMYEYLNRAIKLLSNYTPDTAPGGPIWDPLLIYVNLPIQSGNYVILPAEVEKPLRVNIAQNPAFPRGQLFEFTMNGPGSSATEAGWQWQDRGVTPLQRFMQGTAPLGQSPTAYSIGVTSDNGADNTLSIQALIQVADPTGAMPYLEKWVTIGIGSGTYGTAIYDIRDVVLPGTTVGNVSITTTPGGIVLAKYPAGLIHAQYAVIKLSQSGQIARILARRKTYKVALPTDFIPLHNELAIITAVQAVKLYEELDFTNGPIIEAKAYDFLLKEQQSRDSFASLGTAIDTPTPLNLNIIARDVLQVNDIYDEACSIFGSVGQAKIFDMITEAIEVLGNESQWDPMIGYVDLITDGNWVVTLPREVDQILAMNVNGHPGEFRSKWFEFNLDGLGEADVFDPNNQQGIFANDQRRPIRGWEEVGEVVTAYDINASNYLMAWPFSASDIGSTVTAYGYDQNNNPVVNSQGALGVQIPCSNAYSDALTGPKFSRITRITKVPTKGFVGLVLTDGVQDIQTLGTYYPDDIEPKYRRIRIGVNSVGNNNGKPVRIRMRYRKRWKKIQSLTDVIPLKSRSALTIVMRYLTSLKAAAGATGTSMWIGLQIQQQLLQSAIQMANDEWRASNPQEKMTLQLDHRTWGGSFHPVY